MANDKKKRASDFAKSSAFTSVDVAPNGGLPEKVLVGPNKYMLTATGKKAKLERDKDKVKGSLRKGLKSALAK